MDEINNLISRLESGFLRLKDFDAQLSQRFDKNISLFEKYFPDIYKEMASYKPSCQTVFLEADGTVNLFFPSKGNTLFPENAQDSINNKFSSFIENPGRTWLGTGTHDNEVRFRHEYYMDKLNKLKLSCPKKENTALFKGDMIGGVVFFGFELGYQLEKMIDFLVTKHIYIYEKNLDFFYYSLFAIDWDRIFSKVEEQESTLHFFLGVSPKEFINSYMPALRHNGLFMASSTYLYIGYNSDEATSAFEEFSSQYARQVFGWGFYDDAIIGISHFMGRTKDAFLLKSSEKPRKAFSLPVFILGNGPSLDKAIPFIEKNRDKIVLVSCGTTINTLFKLGIKPDFQVDVERMRHTAEKFSRLPKDYLEGVIALTANVMHPHFYDYFDKTLIGLKPGEAISSMMNSGVLGEDMANKVALLSNSGPIVANTAMSYFINLNAEEIYLFGVDCGFKDPNKHHSTHSGYFSKDGENSGLATYKDGLIERPANYGGTALTNLLFDSSRIQLEIAIKNYKERNKRFSCFNLSDGVYIEGATPLDLEDVLISFSNVVSKKEYVDRFVDENCFLNEPRDYSEEYKKLNGKVNDVVVFLKRRLSERLSSKEDVIQCFREINSYLLKKAYTEECYIHDLLQGSFTYFANEVVSLMFNHEFEFSNVQEMLDIWTDFLDEVPDMFNKTKDFIDPGRGALEGLYHY